MSKNKRKPNIAKSLINSSISAFYAMIEVHNKPNIEYRYQTSTILAINAWELIFKAYIYKYIDKKKIWKENNYTISFRESLDLFIKNATNILSKENLWTLKENLEVIENYRNIYVHYNLGELDPILFGLLLKTSELYIFILREIFNYDILENHNFVILPIGLRLPYSPIEYLRKDEFISNPFYIDILKRTKKLNEDGIKDSIFVGIEAKYISVKKIDNADILISVGKDGEALISKKVELSDEKGTQPVHLSDEELKRLFPFTYNELVLRVKEKNPDFKKGKIFNNIMKNVKPNKSMCHARYANIHSRKGTPTYIYNEEAVEYVLKKYVELLSSSQENTKWVMENK